MADISKIKLPSNTEYNLKDAQARSDISTINDTIGTIAADYNELSLAVSTLDADAIKTVKVNGTALTETNNAVDIAMPIVTAVDGGGAHYGTLDVTTNEAGDNTYYLLTEDWYVNATDTIFVNRYYPITINTSAGTATITTDISGSAATAGSIWLDITNGTKTVWFIDPVTYKVYTPIKTFREEVSGGDATYTLDLLSYEDDQAPGGTGYVPTKLLYVHLSANSSSVAPSGTYEEHPLSTDTYNSSSHTAMSGIAVADAIAAASIGGASFQGVVNAQSTITNANYKKGWYWAVGTAGTYVGQTCEQGDFIFAINDKGSSYSASDFSVVQANIDMSIFGDMAFVDTGTATFTPGGTVSQPTFTGSSTTSTGSFTPEGSVSLTTSNTTATVSSTTGEATYTPAGSVTAPTISVSTAGTTTTIKNPTKETVAKTVVAAAPGATAPSNSLTYYAVSNETLSLYQLGYTTGDSITTSDVTVKTGDASYSATAPTFTGTGARLVTGNIAVPTSASFTGTAGSVSVSGTPSGTVSQPTFTGTQQTITVNPTSGS